MRRIKKYCFSLLIPILLIISMIIPSFSTFGADGETKEFSYTGNIQTYTAPKAGKYFVQLYGASGGGVKSGDKGGYGGYTEGYVNLSANQTIYIAIGQQGSVGGGATFNGGGAANGNKGAGGGATSITTTNRGALSNFASYKNEIIAVAGGGGGQNPTPHYKGDSEDRVIGSGGGLGGGSTPNATGGTQETGYAFGQGGSATSTEGGAGGGGYYGGQASWFQYYGGGGGSSYIDGLYNAKTNETTHIGNGWAKITYIGNVSGQITLNVGEHGYYNGQNGKVALTGNYGETITISNPTVDSGYTFKGWELVSGSGAITNNQYTFNGTNVEFKAIYDGPLILSSTSNDVTKNSYVILQWSQDDETSKDYEVQQSYDNANWAPVYFSSDSFLSSLKKTYNYTGYVQTYTAPISGTYMLQLYGSKGENGSTAAGGKGAYVYAEVKLTAGQTIYLQVGGQSGWNGGGSASNNASIYSYGKAGAGGGATSITTTNRGVLSNFASYKDEIIAIAGGGGGGAGNGVWGGPVNIGGQGGNAGLTGSNGNSGGSSQGREVLDGKPGTGASQSSGGSGGGTGSHHSHGEDNTYYAGGGGGGGGGYFGGGGGGSGYMDYNDDDDCRGNSGTSGSFGQGGKGGSSWSAYAWHSGHGGGGGGGSSYTNSSYVSNPSITSGANNGNGFIVITPKELDSFELGENQVGVNVVDTKAPNIPTVKGISYDANDNNLITWQIPDDNGNTYYYRVISYTAGTRNVLKTSNVLKLDVKTEVEGYRYIIDTASTTTVTINNGNFTKNNSVTITPATYKRYIHVAAIDHAGNISGTSTYEIPPLTYNIQYHSNTSIDTSTDDTIIKDDRTFYFGSTYNLKANPFKKVGIGYYGQELNYNFVGWGFKKYTPFTKTNATYPYLYKTNLITKVTNFMTGTPNLYVPSTVIANAIERPYYYNNDTFYNLTIKNNQTITFYAEWIADNQRPYGGFTFKVLQYNDDGTTNGVLKNDPYDSYDVSNYNELTKNNTVYDDNVYFINAHTIDPEGNSCINEYQYSIDNGTTWYKLTTSIPSTHKSYLNVKNYSTKSGTLMGITFSANKTILIRMRTRDTVSYPLGNTYNASSKTYETFELQKPMWSTGYFVDASRNDYDSNGKYLGDVGTKGNQGGGWYTKTITCQSGNRAPVSDLVADYINPSIIPENYTYEDIVNIVERENFFNFPMYDYTSNNETWNYKNGNLYLLISKNFEANANANNDEELLAKFYNVNINKFNYLKDTKVLFIKENDELGQYTTFTPEDESIAFLNASSDVDSDKHTFVGNEMFSNYWIAICEQGTTKNVLTTINDKSTTYTNLDTSNATLYNKTINGKTITGVVYSSYEEMVKDIYTRSNSLFATRTDSSINIYDVYFSVCDKSWNLVSPNKWGNITTKTLIVEPRLSVYDILYQDDFATNSNFETYVSLYRNNNKPYYYLSKYTLYANQYINKDPNFDNNTHTVVTMLTLNENAKSNYTPINGVNTFIKNNGAIDTKLGYNVNLLVRSHGAEISRVSIYNTKDELVEVIVNHNFEGTYNNKVMSSVEMRKPLDTYYDNSKYTFAIPEQLNNVGYYIKVEIEKTPYTNKNNKLIRTVFIGDKNNPLIIPAGSSLEDLGINLQN